MSCWSTPSEEPGYEPSIPPATSTCIDVLAILIEAQDEEGYVSLKIAFTRCTALIILPHTLLLAAVLSGLMKL